MSEIISANQSPRIENNILYWYEYDTFAIELEINLIAKENNLPITTKDSDQIIVSFYKDNIPIYKFCHTNFNNGDKIVLDFSNEVSKKFSAGIYEYRIVYIGPNTTTIVAKNNAEVEKWVIQI